MCQKPIIDNLLAIAAAYGRATGKSRTSISKEFYGRGDFLDDLENRARTISVSRLDKILDDFRAKWPSVATWPSTVPVDMSQHPE